MGDVFFPLLDEVYDPFIPAADQQDLNLVIRSRQTYAELRKLNTAKATGPDGIGAKILRHLASELAVSLAKLCRMRSCLAPEKYSWMQKAP